MKKIFSLVTLVVVICMLSSCGVVDTSSNGAKSSKPVESVQPTAKRASNTLGDYKVDIKSAKLAKDYEGKSAVIVTYKWTNNSKKTTSFMVALMTKVFQNGVECDNAIVTKGIDADNYMKEIKPAASLEVQMAYTLQDKSNISVEVSELISFSSDIVTKDFSLK